MFKQVLFDDFDSMLPSSLDNCCLRKGSFLRHKISLACLTMPRKTESKKKEEKKKKRIERKKKERNIKMKENYEKRKQEK